MAAEFVNDYRQFAEVMANRRPDRLVLYEHHIAAEVIEQITGESFAALIGGDERDRVEFFRHYCGFCRSMRYDAVNFEAGVTSILPDSGALAGGRPGPIQSRDDFERYPWAELATKFRKRSYPQFEALAEAMPEGMKAVGGIGNGVFEIAEDLVGLEYLPFIQVDDPDLYRDLFNRIGDLMVDIWADFLPRYGEHFVACRFGDDLGFKSSLLTNPSTIREHILPQYDRVIRLVKSHSRPFLWHSCGCIFEIMDDVIALGIDAKHSNEDAIAPYERWISDYGDRIALFGGFDLDFLCSTDPDEIYRVVLEQGRRYRAMANGYGLGSGNSIPDYVPAANYEAMLRAGHAIQDDDL